MSDLVTDVIKSTSDTVTDVMKSTDLWFVCLLRWGGGGGGGPALMTSMTKYKIIVI